MSLVGSKVNLSFWKPWRCCTMCGTNLRRASCSNTWKGKELVIYVGARVKTITYVDRRPLFEVPPHQLGTVVRAKRDFVAVQMDERIEGCEEWHNQIRFIPDDCGEYWYHTTLDTVEKVFFYHFCLTGEGVDQEEKV